MIELIDVSFDFYKETYAGEVIPDERSFKQPLMKANIYLNQVMRKELNDSYLETVRLCLCEISDLIYQDSTCLLYTS